MTSTPSSPKLPDKLRLLAASMRHSAGQWMVPGWDGHKVADLLSDAQASIQALEAEVAGLSVTADEDAHVIERLGTLLACVSIALKGDELPLHRHSYHDLADVADAIKLELDLYRALFPNGIPSEVLDAAIDTAMAAQEVRG